MKYLILTVFCIGIAIPFALGIGTSLAEEEAAWVAIQKEIASRLISPGTASFGDQTAESLIDGRNLWRNNDGGWCFFGYVDATNRMGGTERIDVLVIHATPKWQTRFTWPDGRHVVWSKCFPNGMK